MGAHLLNVFLQRGSLIEYEARIRPQPLLDALLKGGDKHGQWIEEFAARPH